MRALLLENSRCSWRAYFLLQTGWRQLFEVAEIKRVNALHCAPRRAAQQQSVVNSPADPSAVCHHLQRLQVILFGEGHDLKMREDVLGDDTSRLDRMYARMDRQVRECGKDFRNRVPTDEALVASCGDAQQRRPSLSVVWMALLGGSDEDCRVEENIQLATLSEWSLCALHARHRGCAPSWRLRRQHPDGPRDRRP